MSEQKIQASIIKYLESKGAYVVKVITASKKGVPDILACYKGQFIAIEVKRPETKTNVSSLQAYNLKKIEETGGLSLVAWDLVQVKSIII
jgi:Holliday junction resolvase